MLRHECHAAPQVTDLPGRITHVVPPFRENAQALPTLQDVNTLFQGFPVQRAGGGDRLERTRQPEHQAAPPDALRVLRAQEHHARQIRHGVEHQEAIDPVPVRPTGYDHGFSLWDLVPTRDLDAQAEEVAPNQADAGHGDPRLDGARGFEQDLSRHCVTHSVAG